MHDEDLRGSFLPKITNILREEDTVDQFTPVLEKLTDAEIDKLEKDRERDKRYRSIASGLLSTRPLFSPGIQIY